MNARRLLPALVLLGMSFFLYSQAGGSAADFTLADVRVADGTVATVESTARRSGPPNRQRTSEIVLVTLADRPQNLAFRLTAAAGGGIAPGAQVRFEVLDDPQAEFARAERFPDSTFEVRAVGASVDGRELYSAAAEVERADSAGGGYRFAALACLVLGLAWVGVLVYRRNNTRDT